MTSTRPYRRAFSLLELLAVVTILGVIAAVIVPRVVSSTETANEAVESHHLAQLNSLAELHYLTHWVWPDNVDDLSAVLPDGPPTPPNGGSYEFDNVEMRFKHVP